MAKLGDNFLPSNSKLKEWSYPFQLIRAWVPPWQWWACGGLGRLSEDGAATQKYLPESGH